MKRFKVVQDQHRNWGILDTSDGVSFARWDSYDGDYRFWPEVVDWAMKLNAGTAEIDDFYWDTYDD